MRVVLSHVEYQGIYGVLLALKLLKGETVARAYASIMPAQVNNAGVAFELDEAQANEVVTNLLHNLEIRGFQITDHQNWTMKFFKDNCDDPSIIGSLQVIWQLRDQGFKYKWSQT